MVDAAARVFVFYDYVCPYAYLGKHRADRLEENLDVDFVWLPWEIYPEANPAGEPRSDEYPPTRVEEWIEALGEEIDVEFTSPPRAVNSNRALRGAEYARDQGDEVFERYHENCFRAVWGDGQDLGDDEVLRSVAHDAGIDVDDFFDRIDHNAYQHRLHQVDRYAEKLGIQRVPTFVFGDQRIVGNDPYHASLRDPLIAFLERWKYIGAEHTTTLEWDVGLYELVE